MALRSIFLITILLLSVGLIYGNIGSYNFETPGEEMDFVPRGRSTRSRSTERFKTGTHSLLWTYGGPTAPDQYLRLRLSKNAMGNAGMKFWIWNEVPVASKCLTVKANTNEAISGSCSGGDLKHTSQFHISLNFSGWRAVWISYNEFKICHLVYPGKRRGCSYNQKILKRIEIHAPKGVPRKELYIDALRFYDSIGRQSRDKIVPLITSSCLSCASINTVTKDDALTKYPRSKYWQQTYRWGATTVFVPPVRSPLGTAELNRKLTDIEHIEERFDNWFANESKSYIKLPGLTSSDIPSSVETDFFVRKRWEDLMKNVDNAYREFTKLGIRSSGSVYDGKGLFVKFSDYPKAEATGEKFGHVMQKILLPLALEYYLKSRDLEVKNTACQLTRRFPRVSDIAKLGSDDLIAVVGRDRDMKKCFRTNYISGPPTTPKSATPPTHHDCDSSGLETYPNFMHAIDQLNEKRKNNLILLLNYLEDQGWAQGSAAGSTNHEMNKSGAGFANAVFLLRKILQTAGKLDSVLATLKWYTDFNEIYQTPNYEYNGTTADRMRTILLFRLMAVIMMPNSQEKVRDMTEWKRWYDNAFRINGAMGGVIKPDYTGFHHHTFYGSAYIPQALETASIARYLIAGSYLETGSSDTASKENLKKALNVLKYASVLHSTPNSISGRFPGYSNGILAKRIATFAYLSLPSGVAESNIRLSTPEARAFLRLYDLDALRTPDCTTGNAAEKRLKKELCKGRVDSSIHYFNSLGSLQIMQKLKHVATSSPHNLVKETSPVGHWAKNFAAMSIHRRKDWVVTMKGFNQFVWDVESTRTENVFGLYQSHGALQISNSEDELERYDIENGWDWTKIPGTTTIGFAIPGLRTEDNRRFNPQELAGGVTFNGKSTYNPDTLNGAFGQHFTQPKYKLCSTVPAPPPSEPTAAPLKGVTFSFKKSVFFIDDFLLCLGTNITAAKTPDALTENTHTTLFQNKLKAGETFTATPNVHNCGSAAKMPDDWKVQSVVLQDAMGNRYFIKDPDGKRLHFKPNVRQTSYKSNGDITASTTGQYCTAWFDHGVAPSPRIASYEYAVKVKGSQQVSSPTSSDYKVIKGNEFLHLVKIGSSGRAIFGYVVFDSHSRRISGSSSDTGPIEKIINGPAVVMARWIDNNNLAISVSSPHLNMKQDTSAPSWCTSFKFPPRPPKTADFKDNYKFCAASSGEKVKIKLKSDAFSAPFDVTKIWVNGILVTTDSHFIKDTQSMKFINLKNGFTTEVVLTKA